jgi:hypothetical protein
MAIICGECNKTFETVAQRNKHLRLRHIKCDVCNVSFRSQGSFNLHVTRRHNEELADRLPDKRLFKCQHCGLQFLQKRSRDAHINRLHLMARLAVRCAICRTDFQTVDDLQQHKRVSHPYNPQTGFVSIQNAFRRSCDVLRLLLPCDDDAIVKSVDEFHDRFSEVVRRELRSQLNERGAPFKVWLILFADLYKVIDFQTNKKEQSTFYLRTPKDISYISDVDDIDEFIQKSREPLRSRLEGLLTQGSNWSIWGISACTLEIARAKPLNGSCITDRISIRTLKDLNNLNLIYSDDREFPNGCLYYAVAKYFKHTDNMEILNEYVKTLNRKNITCPVSLNKLDSFEEQNQDKDFKINVLEVQFVQNRSTQLVNVYPLRTNPTKSATNIINLLWVRFYSEVLTHKVNDREDQFYEFGGYDGDESAEVFLNTEICSDSDNDWDEGEKNEVSHLFDYQFHKIYEKRGHFMLIENLDVFLHYHNRKFICVNCLIGFRSFVEFEKHENVCNLFKPTVIKMPQSGTKMKFINFNKKFKVPFMAFYDFEAVLEPVPNGDKCFNCLKKNVQSCPHSIKVINRQIPSCYSLIVVDNDRNIRFSSNYTGRNCVQHFLNALFSFRDNVFSMLKEKEEMIITEGQELEYQKATHCHICEKPFTKHDVSNRFLGRKCHDHDHLTGLYLGAAHNQCNLNRRKSFNIPAICHNSAKYDSHFILTELNMILNPGSVTAIPANTESFKTFSVGGITFLDSLAFLNMSLAQLANDLKLTPNYDYKILDSLGLYEKEEKEKKEMLLSKQIYPYEYMTSFDIFNERQLPYIEYFSSLLSNKDITQDEYMHACRVFELFGCENLKDYTELYCILDVGLLAEVVMHFRDIIYDDGNLDLMHYLSLPQLTLDYMLKTTGNEIELLTDSTMHVMLEQSIRGGVVFCAQRLVDENDLQDDNTDVIYVDMNNLYGQSMSSLLPYGDYHWCDVKDLEQIDWLNICTEGTIGYILQVDLDYPYALHESHADFPVAPVNTDMSYEKLGHYAKSCLNLLQNKEIYKAKKLIASLEPKEKYLLHFANLKYYLSLGLKLRKIHSGFSFTQKACFASYVDYCTQKRKNSVSKFQGSTYKTLSNSLFGKTMESKRDRLKCSFVSKEAYCTKFVSESNTVSYKVLNENLVCVFRKQKSILMDKPIAIGFTILERAKLLMYKLYYDDLKPKFAMMRCIYTDTDSLLLLVRKFAHQSHKTVFEIISYLMDFSNYDPSHPLFSLSRKNQLGFIKDELAGQTLKRFVGLRSKTYCIEMTKNEKNKEQDKPKIIVIRKAKGVSSQFQYNISFDSYLDCLTTIKQNLVEQVNIQAHNHELVTQRVTKVSFSSFDDKRLLFVCGIHSTAYGDYRILESQKCPICDINVLNNNDNDNDNDVEN